VDATTRDFDVGVGGGFNFRDLVDPLAGGTGMAVMISFRLQSKPFNRNPVGRADLIIAVKSIRSVGPKADDGRCTVRLICRSVLGTVRVSGMLYNGHAECNSCLVILSDSETFMIGADSFLKIPPFCL